MTLYLVLYICEFGFLRSLSSGKAESQYKVFGMKISVSTTTLYFWCRRKKLKACNKIYQIIETSKMIGFIEISTDMCT